MKANVNRKEFLAELACVAPIVDKSPKMPILTHILLAADTETNRLILTGSDMDVTLRTKCAADILRAGSVALPARELAEWVRFLPDEATIEIDAEDAERVNLRSGRSRTRMVCQSAETYPMVHFEPLQEIALPGDILRQMIQMTIFSLTTETGRFTLSGIKMVVTKSFMRMVSTDAHRMAFTEAIKPFDQVEGEISVLIPKKTVSELAKIVQAESATVVYFSQDENHLYFRIGDRLLISRVLVGQFPNYELVIPRNLTQHVSLNTEEFKRTIHRATIMADETSRRLQIEYDSDKLVVKAENVKKGEIVEEIPIDYSGQSVVLGYNSQYLIDFLNAVGSEEIWIDFTDHKCANMLRPKGDNDITYKYVVMPMGSQ